MGRPTDDWDVSHAYRYPCMQAPFGTTTTGLRGRSSRPGESPEAVVGCVTYPKGGYRSTPPTEAREKPVFCARRAATSYIKPGFLRAFPGLFGQKVRGRPGCGLSDGCPIPSGGGPVPDNPRTFCPKSPGKARKRPGFIYDVAALRAQKPGFLRA